MNPHDTSRTCGGSSGGDAGLIAARCVPFAVGSDLGGSGRVPPLFCGISSLKPTNHRTSLFGIKVGFPPVLSIPIRGCPAPIGKTVDDVVIGTKFFFNPNMNRIDPTTLACPWNEELYQKGLSGKIKIGYCDSLCTTPAMESVKRAIHEAKKALEEQGYELVEVTFTPEEIKLASEIMVSFYGHYMYELGMGQFRDNYEEPIESNELNSFILESDNFRYLPYKLWLKMRGDGRIAEAMDFSRPKSSEHMEYMLLMRLMN